MAQTVTQSGADLQAAQQAEHVRQHNLGASLNTQLRQGRYGTATAANKQGLRPFGASLFDGGFSGVRADGLNPAYKIAPGDQVILRAWGAVDIDRIMPVDSQGNIFIPSVGPVNVLGLPHAQLDQVVRQAVKRIYPNNVNVYTNLTGVQPVAVFVAGQVQTPGRYAGTPNDSLLYFLNAAGGINAATGSYRKIDIIRAGQRIETVDLYQFLKNGLHPDFQFDDGDTIFVNSLSKAITVTGDVSISAQYELSATAANNTATNDIDRLLDLAKPLPHATGILLRGIRNGTPFSRYLSISDTLALTLEHGDELIVNSDQHPSQIVVQVEGSYLGQSIFTVPRGTTLKAMLQKITIDTQFADIESISLRRLSVQQRQRESINDSLQRLETTYLGASSATAEEASIRVREAELIQSFVNRARELQPSGRLVVSQQGELVDVRLQDGDVITIPEKSDSLLISGEVLVPQSVVFDRHISARKYIKGAGGFTQHADKRRVLVIRNNGEVRELGDVKLRGGDEILVLPKAPTKNLQLAASLSQIIYQIAIAARVALDV